VETLNALDVDKGLITMFLKMSPEQRLEANDNAVRTILELRVELKRTSKHPKDKQCLPVLEETLRQLDANSYRR